MSCIGAPIISNYDKWQHWWMLSLILIFLTWIGSFLLVYVSVQCFNIHNWKKIFSLDDTNLKRFIISRKCLEYMLKVEFRQYFRTRIWSARSWSQFWEIKKTFVKVTYLVSTLSLLYLWFLCDIYFSQMKFPDWILGFDVLLYMMLCLWLELTHIHLMISWLLICPARA